MNDDEMDEYDEFDEYDSIGLIGIEDSDFDETDFDYEDVTEDYGEDLDTLTIDGGISEEVMLVNNTGLSFDLGDIGQNNSKTVYIKERVMEKIPIKTKFGTIWCNLQCDTCSCIGICTKSMDNYINSLADIGATPKCRAGYKLMRKKSTGKLVCVRSKPTAAPAPKRKKKSPFSPFFIFPKHKTDPLKRSAASVGNFLFAVAVIGGLALVAPKVMKVAERGATYGLDSWKKIREIKKKKCLTNTQ